jgi:hypothetical protein
LLFGTKGYQWFELLTVAYWVVRKDELELFNKQEKGTQEKS